MAETPLEINFLSYFIVSFLLFPLVSSWKGKLFVQLLDALRLFLLFASIFHGSQTFPSLLVILFYYFLRQTL